MNCVVLSVMMFGKFLLSYKFANVVQTVVDFLEQETAETTPTQI